MSNFWDSDVWGGITLVAVLLISLLVANIIKRSVRILRNSLIPTSVLGGLLLLGISILYRLVAKQPMFDTEFFGGNGSAQMEIITYHCLALGFIATVFKPGKNHFTRKRSAEIFDTGVTTVATYLLQAVLGLGISILWALCFTDFFSAAGILLPFGYGQGTGQALNYGTIYENDYSFVGGKSFGLTIAALGFLCASIGGVIHLAILKRKYNLRRAEERVPELNLSDVQSPDEIPMNGSIDKFTVQMGLVFSAYLLSYLLIYGISALIPGFRSVLYGFNFLFGVLSASLIMWTLNLLHRASIIKREYVSPFLMKRISGFFFDLMIVAGIAAIRIEVVKEYWGILLILGLVGAVSTYFYNHATAKKLFPEYAEEQFLAMYGMLTGTASTGIVLLREIDNEFKTPVSENLVYQNFPAIVFGFPMMLLATFAPKDPLLTLGILFAFFAVMNVILFRRQIFKRKK